MPNKTILSLPDQLLAAIFSHLDNKTRLAAASVNHQFLNVTQNYRETIWEHFEFKPDVQHHELLAAFLDHIKQLEICLFDGSTLGDLPTMIKIKHVSIWPAKDLDWDIKLSNVLVTVFPNVNSFQYSGYLCSREDLKSLVRLVDGWPNLKSLSIDTLMMDDEDEDDEDEDEDDEDEDEDDEDEDEDDEDEDEDDEDEDDETNTWVDLLKVLDTIPNLCITKIYWQMESNVIFEFIANSTIARNIEELTLETQLWSTLNFDPKCSMENFRALKRLIFENNHSKRYRYPYIPTLCSAKSLITIQHTNHYISSYEGPFAVFLENVTSGSISTLVFQECEPYDQECMEKISESFSSLKSLIIETGSGPNYECDLDFKLTTAVNHLVLSNSKVEYLHISGTLSNRAQKYEGFEDVDAVSHLCEYFMKNFRKLSHLKLIHVDVMLDDHWEPLRPNREIDMDMLQTKLPGCIFNLNRRQYTESECLRIVEMDGWKNSGAPKFLDFPSGQPYFSPPQI